MVGVNDPADVRFASVQEFATHIAQWLGDAESNGFAAKAFDEVVGNSGNPIHPERKVGVCREFIQKAVTIPTTRRSGRNTEPAGQRPQPLSRAARFPPEQATVMVKKVDALRLDWVVNFEVPFVSVGVRYENVKYDDAGTQVRQC